MKTRFVSLFIFLLTAVDWIGMFFTLKETLQFVKLGERGWGGGAGVGGEKGACRTIVIGE